MSELSKTLNKFSDDKGISRFLFPVLGLILATPLMIQATPLPGSVLGIFVPIIIIGGYFSVQKLLVGRQIKFDIYTIFLSLAVLFYGYGMLRTHGDLSLEVWKDFLRGCYFASIAVIVSILVDTRDKANVVIEWFRRWVIVFALVSAALGAIKYRLFLDGILIEVIVNQSPEYYPRGTSLVSDYNFFALTLLIGTLVTLGYWIKSKTRNTAFFYGVLLGFLINIGVFAGSRRFWLLLTIILITVILIASIKKGRLIKENYWAAMIFGMVLALGLVFFLFSKQASMFDVNSNLNRYNKGSLYASDSNTSISTAKTLLNRQGAFGLESRLDRWIYGLQLLNVQKILVGDGFSYRASFSCKFLDCQGEDYPHSPIISALLYSGVLGMLVIMALYLCGIYCAFILIKNFYFFDIGFAMIATILFTMISGDSIFSMPVLLAMFILTKVALIGMSKKTATTGINSLGLF